MASKEWSVRATGALKRYRVMAWVTGSMLLVLTLHVLLQIVQARGAFSVSLFEEKGLSALIPGSGTVVPIAHGWIYVVYLVTVVDLWGTMRWRFGRLVTMVLAGVVPAMSFVLERRVHRDGQVKLASVTRLPA